MEWDLEHVRRLAPDLLTFERSQDLLKPSRWKQSGRRGSLIWGQCRTGGLSWYHVALELDKVSSFSNSPSAQQPDKYVLALATLMIRGALRFPETDVVPYWVTEGFRRKAQRENQSAAEQESKKVQARRRARQKRLLFMHEGVQDLERWLEDVVREGIGEWFGRGEEQWEAIATRMVDQKIGAIGKRVRNLYQKRHLENWMDICAAEIADLYLFVQAFKKLDDWPQDRQEELLRLAGKNAKKAELLERKGQTDFWLILSREEGVDDNLRYRRTWLWGERSQQPALLLDFTWGDTSFEHDWRVGAAIQAELVYYPGVRLQRALVKNFSYDTRAFAKLEGASELDSFLREYARALSQTPWMQTYPALLANVSPFLTDAGDIQLADAAGNSISLRPGHEAWKLLALGGGDPLLVFGEWDGHDLLPLMALAQHRVVRLRYTQ